MNEKEAAEIIDGLREQVAWMQEVLANMPPPLEQVLKLHAKWQRQEEGGVQLDLSGADLCGANLCAARLRGANLGCADLFHADMHSADLHAADMRDVDMHETNLSGANLSGANLSGAKIAKLRDHEDSSEIEAKQVDVKDKVISNDRLPKIVAE